MRCFSVRPNRGTLITGLVLGAAALTTAGPAVPAFAASHRTHAPRARAATSCVDANLMPTAGNIARIDAATLCLINEQRAAAGIPALVANAALARAAVQHSAEMFLKNYFGHIGPTGSTPQIRLTLYGYIKPNTAWSIGENIAAGTGSYATPEATVTMWMNSSGHRANILNPTFQDSGIGVVAAAPPMVGLGRGATYTQDFGADS